MSDEPPDELTVLGRTLHIFEQCAGERNGLLALVFEENGCQNAGLEGRERDLEDEIMLQVPNRPEFVVGVLGFCVLGGEKLVFFQSLLIPLFHKVGLEPVCHKTPLLNPHGAKQDVGHPRGSKCGLGRHLVVVEGQSRLSKEHFSEAIELTLLMHDRDPEVVTGDAQETGNVLDGGTKGRIGNFGHPARDMEVFLTAFAGELLLSEKFFESRSWHQFTQAPVGGREDVLAWIASVGLGGNFGFRVGVGLNEPVEEVDVAL